MPKFTNFLEKNQMKLAVVGVTGMVGQVMRKVLEEQNFQITEFIPVASEKSVGKQVEFKSEMHTIVSMDDAIAMKPDIAIFSAGGSISLAFAPKFAEVGTTVIDNSSAWRMSPDHKLIVPEINGDSLSDSDKIIANPNCSTIQMVMALAPLHNQYGIKRVVVSTYQSVTGTGKKAKDQMFSEREGGEVEDAVYPYPIDQNCIPHCDVFLENDYTKEEMKLVNETRKILGDDSIQLTATAVRVPVIGGHSEAVNIEFHNDFSVDEVKSILSNTHGVVVQDNPSENSYPMPLMAVDQDEVFVGRIRRDHSQPNTLNLWIVADNLRKGAATNAVQIAKIVRQLAPVTS